MCFVRREREGVFRQQWRVEFLSWFPGDLSNYPGRFRGPVYLKGIRVGEWLSERPGLLPASPWPLPWIHPANRGLTESFRSLPYSLSPSLPSFFSQIPASPALPKTQLQLPPAPCTTPSLLCKTPQATLRPLTRDAAPCGDTVQKPVPSSSLGPWWVSHGESLCLFRQQLVCLAACYHPTRGQPGVLLALKIHLTTELP